MYWTTINFSSISKPIRYGLRLSGKSFAVAKQACPNKLSVGIKSQNFLQPFCIVVFLYFSVSLNGQTKNYATMAPVSTNTDDVSKAHDSDLATFASVRAYAGVALGLGAYTGYIEIEFPSIVPANTTSYVRMSTEVATIMPALLSGGNSGYSAGVLVGGNQEFTVEVKNNTGTVVVTGDSPDSGELATIKLTVVINSAGEYFLRITPDVSYKRIRLTNRVGGLLLGTIKRLYVNESFYLTNIPTCNHPVYTNYSVAGSVTSTQASVTGPEKVVDADLATFSAVTISALSGGQSVQQTVFLESLSNSVDTFNISLSTTQAMINAGVANNVTVIAYNGATVVQTLTLAQLLTANSATMVGGQVITLSMSPAAAVDRISVKITAVSGGARSINFHRVKKKPPLPVITLNNPVCQGSAASLIATITSPGASLKWYDSALGTNLLATSISGQTIITSPLTSTVTLYVGLCEEFLLPVVVTVVPKPVAGSITGDQTICSSKQPAMLTSVSADSGTSITYRWESSLDGVAWNNIVSNTTAYQPGILTKNTFFRRITINTASGISCESATASIKVTVKNCIVYANPMVRQRIKKGI